MRTVLRPFLAGLAFSLTLTACALIPKNQLDAARTAAAYSFTFYASAYQPILGEYAAYCTKTNWANKPCDRALYKKLYELDGAVAECAGAAQKTLESNSPDFASINICIQRVENAKLAFATAGIKGPIAP